MVKEYIIDEQKQKNKYTSLSIAKVLMTLSVYFIATATLLEHFSPVTTLKTLGFMLSAHAFYFLWKSEKSG
jgi:hypothetical protein